MVGNSGNREAAARRHGGRRVAVRQGRIPGARYGDSAVAPWGTTASQPAARIPCLHYGTRQRGWDNWAFGDRAVHICPRRGSVANEELGALRPSSTVRMDVRSVSGVSFYWGMAAGMAWALEFTRATGSDDRDRHRRDSFLVSVFGRGKAGVRTRINVSWQEWQRAHSGGNDAAR